MNRYFVRFFAIIVWVAGPNLGRAEIAPSNILVSYSFDEENVVTGPDTFRVYQNSKGKVRLSRRFPLSGIFSVEIQDVADDADFPELQGYFQKRTEGKLYAHFAFLTTDYRETLNIALAGPDWFSLKKDGISFWLKTIKGNLYQYSDSMPKRLLPIRTFVWYVVDLAYDIDAGRYDLAIFEEGKSEPVVQLMDQKNAANQKGSAVDKFSFIGDEGSDRSNVVYYVDDVVIGIDKAIVQLPFIAPGRRKLFLDQFTEAKAEAAQKPTCLPANSLADFGMTPEDILALRKKGTLKFFEKAASGSQPPSKIKNLDQAGDQVRAVAEWAYGCTLLENRKPEEALVHFQEALLRSPQGRLFELSVGLALTDLKKWKDADRLFDSMYSVWRDDPRYAVAVAISGTARGDLAKAEEWLHRAAKKSSETADLKMAEWVAEKYFYVLLWNSRFEDALTYAKAWSAQKESEGQEVRKWSEHVGDAAYYKGDHNQALMWFQKLHDPVHPDDTIMLKLSDLYFLTGNLGKERELREKIYGRLSEE